MTELLLPSGRRIRGFAFDYDGTLMITEPANEQAVRDTCAHFGIELPARFDRRSLIGLTNVAIFNLVREKAGLGTANSFEELSDFKRKRFGELVRGCQPVPGALNFVREVMRLGFLTAVVTSASSRSLDAGLAALGVERERFNLIITSEALPKRELAKPHEWPYVTTAAKFRIEPEELMVVEDSHKGAHSARRARVTLALLSTTFSEAALMRWRSDYLARDYFDLAAQLGIDLAG